MNVRECMCSKVISAKPETTICEIAKLMSENHIGCVPIADNSNNIVGLVTDRDVLLRGIACNKNAEQTPVSDIMTTNIYKVTPETKVNEATKLMCDCQIRRLPVIENNKIVGIVTVGDLVNHENVTSEQLANTVEKICRCGENMKNSG